MSHRLFHWEPQNHNRIIKLPASLLLSASPCCHLPTLFFIAHRQFQSNGLWKAPWDFCFLEPPSPGRWWSKAWHSSETFRARPGRGWPSEQTCCRRKVRGVPSQQWHSCQGFELQPMDLPSSFRTVRFKRVFFIQKFWG